MKNNQSYLDDKNWVGKVLLEVHQSSELLAAVVTVNASLISDHWLYRLFSNHWHLVMTPFVDAGTVY